MRPRRATGFRPRDVGGTIGLTVRATDSTGTASAHASLVGPVAASGTLATRVQPAISGTPATGRRLSAGTGSWTARPSRFAYAWFRCNANGRLCGAIAGATANAYAVTAADLGRALVARVRATRGRATWTAYSLRVLVPRPEGPALRLSPAVSGSARQGERLVAAPGDWSGTGTISYRYQWYRCDAVGARCSSVSGATAAGYRLGARDVGATIGLTVRATDSTGTASAHAALAGPIAAAGALALTVQPVLTGTPAAGQQLTVGNGTWTGTPSAYAYAWFRCNANGRVCAQIAGATTSAYSVTALDAGRALVARVTATVGAESQAGYSTRALVAG